MSIFSFDKLPARIFYMFYTLEIRVILKNGTVDCDKFEKVYTLRTHNVLRGMYFLNVENSGLCSFRKSKAKDFITRRNMYK